MIAIGPQTVSSYPASPQSVVYGLYCVCTSCNRERGPQIRYVGITTNGVEFRLYQHLKESRENNYKGLSKSRWIRKHGPENIRAVVIEPVDDSKNLNLREIYWITRYKTYRTPFGLNMTPGGDGVVGYEYSEAQRKNMSEKAKARGLSENVKIAARSRVGTKSHLATSDEETVSAIKRDLWNGDPSKIVADRYGKSQNFISHINNGRTWLHVPWPIGPKQRPRTRELQSLQATGRTASTETRKRLSEAISASWTEERRQAQSISHENSALRKHVSTAEARERNGRRQTTVKDETVREIRRGRESGKTIRELSESFEIGYVTVARIARGESHRWVI